MQTTGIKRSRSPECASSEFEANATALIQQCNGEPFPAYWLALRSRQTDLKVALVIVSTFEGGIDDISQMPTGEVKRYSEIEKAFGDHKIPAGATALLLAIIADRTDVVCELLAAGADANAQLCSLSALHLATINKRFDQIKALVSRGARATSLDSQQRSALHFATTEPIFQILLDAGADAKAADRTGVTPLHIAARLGLNDSGIRLIEMGADLSAFNGIGSCERQTPLHYAVVNNSLKMAEFMLVKGADIHLADSCGNTPLHLAAGVGRLPTVQLLIDYGANLESVNLVKSTPLHRAAASYFSVFETTPSLCLLESHGADMDTRNADEYTPLQIAINSNRLDKVKFFIANGASLEVRDKKGFTPLHRAASIGDAELVDYFVSKGASLTAKDFYGRTPLQMFLKYAPKLTYIAAAQLQRIRTALGESMEVHPIVPTFRPPARR